MTLSLRCVLVGLQCSQLPGSFDYLQVNIHAMAFTGLSDAYGATPDQPIIVRPNLAYYSHLVQYILQPGMQPRDPAWQELLVGFSWTEL